MKVGDRVRRENVLSHKVVVGTVIRISNGYTVVQWDNINGDWYYTAEQAEQLEVILFL